MRAAGRDELEPDEDAWHEDQDRGPADAALLAKPGPGNTSRGAGYSLADLVGPFVFRAFPFAVAGNIVFGEWALDYILALASRITFQ